MQNSSLYSQIKSQVQQFPDQKHLKCPRCDSTNTKFCYYNNYNLSQPRHFCKNCKRYWTKGGALRNIPVGGGSRKNTKRSSSSSTTAAAKRPSSASNDNKNDDSKSISGGEMTETFPHNFGGQFGNFSSVLGSGEGQFGNFIDGLGPDGSGLLMNEQFDDPGSGQNVDPQLGLESGSSNINGGGFLNVHGGGVGGDTGCWGGGSNSWPDLAIYTPGSTFH
ncbi:hypothetical protein BUALT_Bualt02G0120300 [Buddleja alternifolia]|uniref:Dof zinc finger protein n=1 Tax=Buddleja alternifolia TaxID=168488 RepID=A0AAV6Y6K2_9LAMI|nr:hypothetical protein BUALT_Bualt02G0120300 [Buddleja alternifolia]